MTTVPMTPEKVHDIYMNAIEEHITRVNAEMASDPASFLADGGRVISFPAKQPESVLQQIAGVYGEAGWIVSINVKRGELHFEVANG